MVESTNFCEEINIFNCIRIKNFLDKNYEEPEKVYICGKMKEHSIGVKYSFPACEFYVYLPGEMKMFYSEMNSEMCFTQNLKWNQNFFKKIKLSLESSDLLKNTYFSINYGSQEKFEKEEKSSENENDRGIASKNNNLSNNSSNKKSDIVSNPSNENEFAENEKIFLELHFLVEDKDIPAFRLLLHNSNVENPLNLLINKVIEIDKIESQKYEECLSKNFEKDKDITQMEREINRETKKLEKRKKDYLYKFYYLNKEKNKKLNELSGILKKEKKLFI
jgi:hypothetical protein